MKWIQLFRVCRFFLGAKEAAKLVWQLKFKKGKNISTGFLKHPFWLRERGTDMGVFQQVLIEEEYKIPVKQDAKTIIDGGANIGMTSIYLANKYPDAQIISIEAGADNFEILKQNVAAYKNITPIYGAVWGRETNLKFVDTGRGSNLYQVHESDEVSEGSLKAYTVEGIRTQMGWDTIDILKLDVEGAEKSIFETKPEEWITKTKLIMVETHDRYIKDSAKSIWKAIDPYNFSFDFRKETAMLVNEDLLERFKTYH